MNDIEVVPLGTVSPYCKDNKNCPGFLVKYNDKKILLDCGEGISRYLCFPNDLNNLIIIISHLHKDHYSGLSSIAYASYVYKNLGYLKEKIKVYIPGDDEVKVSKGYYYDNGWGDRIKVEDRLEDYNYLMDYGDENYLDFVPYMDSSTYKKVNCIDYDDMKVNFSLNPHNLKTYSSKIEVDGVKIVYTGDTGYENNSLKSFAKDADLLICESTFLKGQIRNSDNHLYAHEAGMIARDANVKMLLLTHFWPEIDKQKYVDEAKEYFSNVEAAEEGKKLILRRSL